MAVVSGCRGRAVLAREVSLQEAETLVRDEQGTAVALMVYKSSCADSREQYPVFDGLSREHADVKFLAFSIDESRADTERFFGKVRPTLDPYWIRLEESDNVAVSLQNLGLHVSGRWSTPVLALWKNGSLLTESQGRGATNNVSGMLTAQ